MRRLVRKTRIDFIVFIYIFFFFFNGERIWGRSLELKGNEDQKKVSKKVYMCENQRSGMKQRKDER